MLGALASYIFLKWGSEKNIIYNAVGAEKSSILKQRRRYKVEIVKLSQTGGKEKERHVKKINKPAIPKCLWDLQKA